MKTTREYFQECFEAEKPKFIKVLKAVPEDKSDYKPHPRSTSAKDLLWLLDGLGVHTGVNLDAVVETSAWLARRLGRPSPSRVVRALAG